MTFALKKRVVTTALIGFSLWPLAQIELVHRFAISPWKLCGWGMYATPRISPSIAILVQQGDEAPAPMRVVPPDLRAASEDFQFRRLWLGDLAAPDEIGKMVLASDSKYRSAAIFIIQPVLDTSSGIIRIERKAYGYDRSDGALGIVSDDAKAH